MLPAIACLVVGCAEKRPDVSALELSVGRVFCEAGPIRGAGSSFVVAEGHVVTNRHVVVPEATANCTKLEVAFSDKARYSATVEATDERRDLALLKVDGPTPLPLPLFAAEEIRKDSPLWVIGFPGGADQSQSEQWRYVTPSVSRGIVSRQHPDKDGVQVVQTQAPMNPGNSGGPILDACGRVIGVATRVRRGLVEGLNWGVYASEVSTFLSTTAVSPVVEEAPCDNAGSLKAIWLSAMGGVGAALLAGLVLLWRQRRGTGTTPVEIEPASGSDPASALMAPARVSSGLRVRFTGGPLSGRSFPIGDGSTVGRDGDIATILLPPETPGVSRRHIEFRLQDGRHTVRDCWSSAGTLLNDRRLTPGDDVGVDAGDRLVLGNAGVSMDVES